MDIKTHPTKAVTLVDTSRIAEMFDVSPRTVREWAREGRVPVYRLPHGFRFSEAEVAAAFREEVQS
jgi:excisionase family DNA binding protein